MSSLSLLLVSPAWAHIPPHCDNAFSSDPSTLILVQTLDNRIIVANIGNAPEATLIPISSRSPGDEAPIAYADLYKRYVAREVLKDEFVVSREACINQDGTVTREQTKGVFFTGPLEFVFLPGQSFAFGINDFKNRLCGALTSENTPRNLEIRCFDLQDNETFTPSQSVTLQRHDSLNPTDALRYSWVVDNRALIAPEVISFLVLAKVNGKHSAIATPTSAPTTTLRTVLMAAAISAAVAAGVVVAFVGTVILVKHCKAKRNGIHQAEAPRLDDDIELITQ